jgi:hypothetical protein
MADLDALKAELLAGHPVTGAYDANNSTAAAQLNAVNRERNLSSITGDQIFEATDTTQFAALTDTERNQWLAFCGRSELDPFGSANVAFVTFIFGGGSATLTNLAALRKESVSRADELNLGRIGAGIVGEARAL